VSGQLVLALAQLTLALVVAAAACVVLRRRVIARRGGVVECCLRASASAPWQHGLAEYRSGQLYWHRSNSFRIRPHTAFERRDLVVIGRRPAAAGDAVWLGPGTMIVTCQARPRRVRSRRTRSQHARRQQARSQQARSRRVQSDQARSDQARSALAVADRASQVAQTRLVELAMSQAALTGYLAWLEAAPAAYLGEAS
jgi:hypothetical protein